MADTQTGNAPQKQQPVWLITGCSTGFGRELATLVIERGWNAVVTSRKLEDVQDIVANHDDQAIALALDVTEPSAIKDAVKQAQERFGRIDVLVNNAGYGYLAAIEEGEDEQVRKLFETNFFGLVNLTNEVLPGMRKQRSGTVVNISSIGGLVSFGATGYYHAAKFAVEGMSESLAKEVEPLGIKVMIVEPGPFRTDWSGRSIQESETKIDDYAGTAGKRREQTHNNSGKQVGDPRRGSEAIIKAVEADDTPLHLILGQPGYDLVMKQYKDKVAEFEKWKELTLSADFPDGE